MQRYLEASWLNWTHLLDYSTIRSSFSVYDVAPKQVARSTKHFELDFHYYSGDLQRTRQFNWHQQLDLIIVVHQIFFPFLKYREFVILRAEIKVLKLNAIFILQCNYWCLRSVILSILGSFSFDLASMAIIEQIARGGHLWASRNYYLELRSYCYGHCLFSPLCTVITTMELRVVRQSVTKHLSYFLRSLH